jgi:hypothetical protein
MKRIAVLGSTLAVAMLLLMGATGEAGEKKVKRSTPSSTVEETQVDELVKLINETKSPNTLVATALALMPLGDKAKPAVPAILRNAERLKMLEDLTSTSSRKSELANMLMEIIYAIQSGWTPDNDRNGGPARFGGPGRGSSWNNAVGGYYVPAPPPCSPLCPGTAPGCQPPPPPSMTAPTTIRS